MENTPEGRDFSELCSREQMKMIKRRNVEWNERVIRLSRPSKTPEGREEKLLKLRAIGK